MMVLLMCSGDDPKKKKADGKRIALTQKHEVAYIKKIAKEQLVLLGAITDTKLEGSDHWEFHNGKLA